MLSGFCVLDGHAGGWFGGGGSIVGLRATCMPCMGLTAVTIAGNAMYYFGVSYCKTLGLML